MAIKQKKINARGVKLFMEDSGKEAARAYLYILKNNHDQPFGLIEDVFVAENCRGQGFGAKLIKKIIQAAKQNNCYKLICTSRHGRSKVHELYLKLGFRDWGREFRIDF